MNTIPRWTKTFVRNSHFLKLAAHFVRPFNSIYHHDYYAETVEDAARESATVMAASMVEFFKPQTVIDVGCGTGALIEAFRQMGRDVYGLEYSNAALAYCHKRALPVRKFNITRDNLDGHRYGLAVSFEVAEHLPAWNADRYIALLCSLSPLIVMSAATPGSGGTDHINEQPHSYWIGKLADKGYSFDQASSAKLAREWKAAGIAYWYADNVMVFRSTTEA